MSANRVNITLGDMQLVQVDMLAGLRGMSRSEYIANLINWEFSLAVFEGHLNCNDMYKLLDERIAQKEKK